MAEKSSRLLLNALVRAASEPEGLALLAGKSEPGLFPATPKARPIAERSKTDGFLQILRTESRGKLTREICGITEKGRTYLLQHSNPQYILEDLLRVLEERETDVRQLTTSVGKLHAGIEGVRSLIESILPQFQNSPSPFSSEFVNNGVNMLTTNTIEAPCISHTTTLTTDAIIAEMKTKLAEWFITGQTQDCPLPELFRRMECSNQMSIGQFHDCLRLLYEDQQIYLHPWTGPLYAMPEPMYALLIGHEIAYYANRR